MNNTETVVVATATLKTRFGQTFTAYAEGKDEKSARTAASARVQKDARTALGRLRLPAGCQINTSVLD